MKETLRALIEAHGLAVVVEAISELCFERSDNMEAAGQLAVAYVCEKDGRLLQNIVLRLSN